MCVITINMLFCLHYSTLIISVLWQGISDQNILHTHTICQTQCLTSSQSLPAVYLVIWFFGRIPINI